MKIKDIVASAIFAALTAACAQVWFPLPVTQVPITLQTLVIYLIVLTADRKVSLASVITYLALGAFGLPVFSGLSSGLGILFGATGGYMWGFILAALAASLLPRKKTVPNMIAKLLIATLCIYLVGTIQLKYVLGISFSAAITMGVLPFLLGDFIKCLVAMMVAKRINI